jgi:hypothetical protein
MQEPLSEIDKAIIRLAEALDEPTRILQAALGYSLGLESAPVNIQEAEIMARLALAWAKAQTDRN